MIAELDPLLVPRRFGFSDANLQSATSGFSGANIWKLTCSWGEYALKAYAPTFDDGKLLAQRHAWLMAAVDRGFELLPRVVRSPCGPSWVREQDRLWDCVTWRPGEPLGGDASPMCLASALAAIARLHNAWPRIVEPGPAPIIERRFRCLEAWRPIQPNPLRRAPIGLGEMRINEIMTALVPAALARLQSWRQRRVELQVVHGDLRPEHVIVHEERVTGVIDHNSIRIDSVAADLARLRSELDSTATLDAYREIRPLGGEERDLVEVLCGTAAVANLAGWSQRLASCPETSPEMDRVRQRIQYWMDRAEVDGNSRSLV